MRSVDGPAGGRPRHNEAGEGLSSWPSSCDVLFGALMTDRSRASACEVGLFVAARPVASDARTSSQPDRVFSLLGPVMRGAQSSPEQIPGSLQAHFILQSPADGASLLQDLLWDDEAPLAEGPGGIEAQPLEVGGSW